MTDLASITVVEAGALTTVQDVGGRRGWEHLGVPACGAVDPFSARLANRLVGNPDDAPLLEATLAGPTLRFDGPGAIALAIAGADLGARLDGIDLAPGNARIVRPGSTLRFGARRHGARAYVAVSGGLAVEPILGSAATDLRAGFGGLDGRALRAGDRLSCGGSALTLAQAPQELATVGAPRAIGVLPGPHRARFADDALERLCATAWRVSAEADRAAVRLDGPSLWPDDAGAAGRAEVASVGVAVGAIQVPPDGRPIVMRADRPVTGGYAVLACAARADVGAVAQLVPGDVARFRLVDAAVAVEALAEQERLLAGVRASPSRSDDAGAWAGSLD